MRFEQIHRQTPHECQSTIKLRLVCQSKMKASFIDHTQVGADQVTFLKQATGCKAASMFALQPFTSTSHDDDQDDGNGDDNDIDADDDDDGGGDDDDGDGAGRRHGKGWCWLIRAPFLDPSNLLTPPYTPALTLSYLYYLHPTTALTPPYFYYSPCCILYTAQRRDVLYLYTSEMRDISGFTSTVVPIWVMQKVRPDTHAPGSCKRPVCTIHDFVKLCISSSSDA